MTEATGYHSTGAGASVELVRQVCSKESGTTDEYATSGPVTNTIASLDRFYNSTRIRNWSKGCVLGFAKVQYLQRKPHRYWVLRLEKLSMLFRALKVLALYSEYLCYLTRHILIAWILYTESMRSVLIDVSLINFTLKGIENSQIENMHPRELSKFSIVCEPYGLGVESRRKM